MAQYVWLCALVALVGGLVGFFYLRNHDRRLRSAGLSEFTFDKDVFYSSYVAHPIVLLVFRAVVAIYSIVILMSVISRHVGSVRTYTVWNFTMLCIYFSLGTALSIIGLTRRHVEKRRESLQPGQTQVLVNGEVRSSVRAGNWEKLHWVLFETCLPCAALIDLVVWTVLENTAAKRRREASSINGITIHALNLVFMITELTLNKLPISPHHFPLVIFWPGLYAVSHWIGVAAGGPIIYPFMDTTVPVAPIWVLGLMVMHSLFFFLGAGLARLRTTVANNCKRPELEESSRATFEAF